MTSLVSSTKHLRKKYQHPFTKSFKIERSIKYFQESISIYEAIFSFVSQHRKKLKLWTNLPMKTDATILAN